MPRIPDDELARLKAIPLAELCQDYGIELKPQGKDLAGRCPFHADNSPSFIVTPSKNLWHCLGACGCGGDTIALVMKKEAVSFRHACEKLRARLGCAPAAATITTGGADGVRFKLLRSTMTNAPGARPLADEVIAAVREIGRGRAWGFGAEGGKPTCKILARLPASCDWSAAVWQRGPAIPNSLSRISSN